MYNITDIRIIQHRILAIAKTFHEIMTRHKIPYYIIGGTMLGAVRHKGFIPWDDDMDLGVPRPYFKQVREILCSELSEPFKLLTIDEGAVPNESYKIEDTRTKIKEQGRSDGDITTGLFIDIFPLDYCNNKWGRFSRNCIIRQLTIYNSYQYKNPSKLFHQLVKVFVRLLPKNILLTIARHLRKTEGDYMINYSGMWGERELMRKEVFGTPVLYPFEDTEFFGVANFDEYLKTLYGNYMQLPPEEKRHTHLLECYIDNDADLPL